MITNILSQGNDLGESGNQSSEKEDNARRKFVHLIVANAPALLSAVCQVVHATEAKGLARVVGKDTLHLMRGGRCNDE